MPVPSFKPLKPIEIDGLKLTEGETRSYKAAPDAKKAAVLAQIRTVRERIAKQLAEKAKKGKKSMNVKEGKIEGLSFGTVVALQERDKEYWAQVKDNPIKSANLMKAYLRRTQATQEEILAYLESV